MSIRSILCESEEGENLVRREVLLRASGRIAVLFDWRFIDILILNVDQYKLLMRDFFPFPNPCGLRDT